VKLKLEMHNQVAVLTVSEGLTPKDGAILRAGLGKLIQSGKKVLLLDLVAVPIKDFDAGLAADLASLQGWAQDSEAQLLIASPAAKIGNAATRAEALHILESPLASLLAVEARLKSRADKLARLKAETEKLLAAGDAQGGDIRTVRQENGRLRKMNHAVEKRLEKLLATRKQDFVNDANRAKADALERTLVFLLKADGVLV
jgi:hypothetical protein